MILDALSRFSDNQALTATAVSQNVIPAGENIGVGHPMAVMITCGAAMAGTNPTLEVSLQTDDNDAFSSATVISTSQQVAQLAAGEKIVIPIGHGNERYLRLNYILGGTSPTVTVSAQLMPMSMIDAYTPYASGYTII